jgi:hypothetical protein
MIITFAEPESLNTFGHISHTYPIGRLAKLMQVSVRGMYERVLSHDMWRVEVPHQPSFDLFRSDYEPILNVYKLHGCLMECAWQPGNATKYRMVIAGVGHRDGSCHAIMAWMNNGIGGKCVEMVSDDYEYLMEKSGFKNTHDFLPMMDLIYLLGYLDIKDRRYGNLNS